jgi:hypothetical protein
MKVIVGVCKYEEIEVEVANTSSLAKLNEIWLTTENTKQANISARPLLNLAIGEIESIVGLPFGDETYPESFIITVLDKDRNPILEY